MNLVEAALLDQQRRILELPGTAFSGDQRRVPYLRRRYSRGGVKVSCIGGCGKNEYASAISNRDPSRYQCRPCRKSEPEGERK